MLPFPTFLRSGYVPDFSDAHETLLLQNNILEIKRELTSSSPQGIILNRQISTQLHHTLSHIELEISDYGDLKDDSQLRENVINKWIENGVQQGKNALIERHDHLMMFEALFRELVKPAITFLLQSPDQSVGVAIGPGNYFPYFFIDNKDGELSLFYRVGITEGERLIIRDQHVMFLNLRQRGNAQLVHSANNTQQCVSFGASLNRESELNSHAGKIIRIIKQEAGLRTEISNQLETAYICIKSQQKFSTLAIELGIKKGCQNLVRSNEQIWVLEVLFPSLVKAAIEFFIQPRDKRERVTVDKNSPDPRFFIDHRDGIPSLFGRVVTNRAASADHHLMFFNFNIAEIQPKRLPDSIPARTFSRNQPAVLNPRTPYQRPQLSGPSPQIHQNQQHNETVIRSLLGNHYDPMNTPVTNLLSWMLIHEGQLHTKSNQQIYLENLCFTFNEEMENRMLSNQSLYFWFPANVELRNCSWQCTATMVLENGSVWTTTSGAMIYATGEKARAVAWENGRVVLENGARMLDV